MSDESSTLLARLLEEIHRLSKRVEELEQRNQELEARNQELEAENKHLKDLLYCVRAKKNFSRSAAQCAALLEKCFFALTDL